MTYLELLQALAENPEKTVLVRFTDCEGPHRSEMPPAGMVAALKEADVCENDVVPMVVYLVFDFTGYFNHNAKFDMYDPAIKPWTNRFVGQKNQWANGWFLRSDGTASHTIPVTDTIDWFEICEEPIHKATPEEEMAARRQNCDTLKQVIEMCHILVDKLDMNSSAVFVVKQFLSHTEDQTLNCLDRIIDDQDTVTNSRTSRPSTTELMLAEHRFGFYNGVYGGQATDYILLEAPKENPDGTWSASAVPIAKREIPMAIDDPIIITRNEVSDFETSEGIGGAAQMEKRDKKRLIF